MKYPPQGLCGIFREIKLAIVGLLQTVGQAPLEVRALYAQYHTVRRQSTF